MVACAAHRRRDALVVSIVLAVTVLASPLGAQSPRPEDAGRAAVTAMLPRLRDSTARARVVADGAGLWQRFVTCAPTRCALTDDRPITMIAVRMVG